MNLPNRLLTGLAIVLAIAVIITHVEPDGRAGPVINGSEEGQLIAEYIGHALPFLQQGGAPGIEMKMVSENGQRRILVTGEICSPTRQGLLDSRFILETFLVVTGPPAEVINNVELRRSP